jgi:16S rRNA (cytosine967-C5)-methyltransferase
MTPAARLQASIELWDKITNNKRVPMDGMCGDYFRNRRYIGSKDRNDIVTRVYDMMRAMQNWNGGVIMLDWIKMGDLMR